jgi:hypothetical protein
MDRFAIRTTAAMAAASVKCDSKPVLKRKQRQIGTNSSRTSY